MTNTTLPNSFDALATGRSSSEPFVDAFHARDPTTSDTQYPIQKKWLNTSTNAFWELKNFTSSGGVTLANWVLLSNQSADTETLTGNDHVVVPPTNNNINVVGDGTLITTTGNAGTSTLTINLSGAVATSYVEDVGTAVPSAGVLNVLSDGMTAHTVGSGNTITISSIYYSLTPYIVGSDTHAQYSTIAAAIAQAVTDGASTTNPKNIYIKPKNGGYTENITISDGINLQGFGQQTLIIGKVTMTAAGAASINGLSLQTNSDFALAVTGSAASQVTLNNCNLYFTNNTGISLSSSSASSAIFFYNSYLNLGTTGITYYSITGSGSMQIQDCYLANTGHSVTPTVHSSGAINMYYVHCDGPIATSGTAGIGLWTTTINPGAVPLNVTALTVNGSGGSSYNGVFSSGTASAISIGAGATLQLSHAIVSSSNANALTGAGTLQYAYLAFPVGLSSGHNVTTSTALAQLT